LADVLDRLAGVLEQQARGLEELRTDVRTLIDGVRQIEARMDALESARPAPPAPADATPPPPAKAKVAGKKRPKSN
jgi:hypothetical protein